MSRNEAQTRLDLIDPALRGVGWGSVEGSRVRVEEVVAAGRLLGGGVRAKRKVADYVLVYKNRKLAVIEAKHEGAALTEGLAQAKDYAQKLQTPFAFCSNGRGIYRVDMRSGREGIVDGYPSPEELWAAAFGEEEARQRRWRERFCEVAYHDKGGQWTPRHYQHNAVMGVLDAIAGGRERILLAMATGTGKTAIAFQIAWVLFNSRWNLRDWRDGTNSKRRPRILFLADRNILADQAFNEFSAFAEDALVRIAPRDIRRRGSVPTNASVFFTIFQTFMTGTDAAGNPQPSFGNYPPDFFDFIVIDECHRGGASDESNWRGIMDHFAPAVQLGLTATPKRRDNIDTYAYFGEPVYIYSLKDGINDGYLTPFKVRQIATTIDEYSYTSDDLVLEGEVEVGKRYTESDFNRIIEIKAREKKRVEIFMDNIDQTQKTLVFCNNQKHALICRDFINQTRAGSETDYCQRVTSDDGELGEQHLRTFRDNEKTIPTILTTSRKLSTGVDARNVRNIVLLRPVRSLIEFKQIIGRGTRLFDGKDYFTVYDFVKAYEHFSDPEWDGEPLDPEPCIRCGKIPCVCETKPPRVCPECGKTPCICERERKWVKIRLADGKERAIQYMAATSFWSITGKPMSAAQFVEQLFGDLPKLCRDEDQLRELWSLPDTRRKLLEDLDGKGYGKRQLKQLIDIIDAEKSDLYDVLAYVAYARAPLSRVERVDSRKQYILAECDDKQREFLDFILAQYVALGVDELDENKLPDLLSLKYGGQYEAARDLGEAADIRELFIGFQKHLYRARAVG